MKSFRKLLVIVLFVFMLAGCIGEASTFTVKFDSQGGTEVANVVIEKGKEIKLPEPPTKEGYEFGGWTLKGSEELFLDSTPITESITLYAKWLEIFDVTFVTNCEATLEVAKVTDGKLVSEPTVENEGFILVGWFTDEELENQFSFNTPVTGDMSLYAKWVDSSTAYTVSFKVNGVVVDTKVVTTGQKVAEPAAPVVDYFTFDGWMNGEDVYDFDAPVHSELELVAKFSQNTFVLQTEQNHNYAEFKAKKADAANDRTTFIKRDVDFLAGDDNAVKLQLVVQLGAEYDAEEDEFGRVYYGAWTFDYELLVLVDGAYVVADKALYVDSFDAATAGVDFSNEAVGKTFKVKVFPQLLTSKQQTRIDEYTVEYEVSVVDGYNVYEEWELLYMDNSTDEYCYNSYYHFWDALRAEKGVNYAPNALVLQNDLTLGVDDIPAQFMWSDSDEGLAPSDSDYERTLGSLKDHATFFYHHIEENGEFHLYGNLFGIDTSSIPVVVRENDNITAEGMAISHAQIFYIYGPSSSQSSIENVSILGNAPKVENKQKAGGLIFAKVEGSNHLTQNIISSGFFITFFPNASLDPYVVNQCKAYDGFNSFIYNWGSVDVTIKNSELIGCGGPIIIQDHIRKGQENEQVGASKFENCTLESFVNGQEGWFTVVGATSLVPVIKQLDAIFNAAGKSFLKTKTDGTNTYTYMNLITVNKSGSAQSFTTEEISGSTQINDGSAFNFGADNPYLAGMLAQCFTYGAPVFQGDVSSLTTGYAYFDGTKLCGLDGQAISEYSLFASNYFCLYYNGMAIVLELFDMGQTL